MVAATTDPIFSTHVTTTLISSRGELGVDFDDYHNYLTSSNLHIFIFITHQHHMSDPRFARLKTDPRFRRPKTKQTKVVIDERFKSVFKQDKKKNAGRKVDKYGRAISDTQEQEDLKRYYRLDDVEDDGATPRKPDLARGEGLVESSDEEDDVKAKDDDDSEDEEGFVTLGADPSRPIAVRDEDLEIDLDEDNFADLDAQAASYSKAHQRDDDDSNEGQEDGVRTSRLAIVNLDWDHVRAHHLYKICSSLVSLNAPATRLSTSSVQEMTGKRRSAKGSVGGPVDVVRGKVLSVKVYPSDFGKERLAREEKEGPPPEIFKKKRDLEVDEVDEKNIFEVGDEDHDYDEDALRRYQLERLRYYYAIVTCDTVDAASHIYNELEGTELERSANVFNLSFVPEDMVFENEPRDEATDDLNTDYKAVEFVTDALRHSKVKLTWDDDDPERNQVTRRALTKKEIEENDFKAYIANTSSESESDEESQSAPKKDKKASRDKLRSLLLGGNEEEMPEGWGDDAGADDVDMEITFTPGLSSKKSEEGETTLEKYQRKMKEKRKKRKEEVKEKGKEKEQALEDDFFEASGDDEPQAQRSMSKKGKEPVTEDQEEPPAREEATAEELALLVGSDNPNAEPKHFSLKSVIKAEKQKKRGKGRKRGKADVDNEAQEDFVVDVKDERFKALFEDHQFAIDPTNPHFKKTKAMSALLDERQKRRKGQRNEEVDVVSKKPKNADADGAKNLQSLVESVKRKSTNVHQPGQGKRRKL
ncbi:unnamed protein product [Cyclocybe aegerita]|uniref:NUC153 domain-containing protein n=1 Tax=Cyclocybe aegerita TaxID=1973307 RepID=A0A8S0VQ58_CYCAE|nr:unnamed protein product [Cyclocybe aegerita]